MAKNTLLASPRFVINEERLACKLNIIDKIRATLSIDFLFPLKTHSLVPSLLMLSQAVQGFAVSSLFEAKLAAEVLDDQQKIHLTTPGISSANIDDLVSLCDGISFNSISQWKQFKENAYLKTNCGLRINPSLSFVKDARYNPSKQQSRLGIPLAELKKFFKESPEDFSGISGLHFHTNCDSDDWTPLLTTVEHLNQEIPEILAHCQWINLGGGYLLPDEVDLAPLKQAIELLKSTYQLRVIIEPGAAIVRDACFLTSKVIDLMTVDGADIAVLDTSVNHMPEVFEYQFSPDVDGDMEDGSFSYIFAGCTCLSGDVFGEYAFDKPLEIGSEIVFTGMGAYTMVKAHMFNGINLPAIYSQTADGELVLHKEYTYDDFRSRCGADNKHAGLRNSTEPECNSQKRRVA